MKRDTDETFLIGYLSWVLSIEKVQKLYYTALEFHARRRQANQEQAKQALTVVISIQLAPS